VPQISMADCGPVLRRKIDEFSDFVADNTAKDGTYTQAVPGAVWLRLLEVIEQTRNVFGALDASKIVAMCERAGGHGAVTEKDKP